LRVLIACEFSGKVREAFRKRGHDAYSCDLIPALDGSPYHYQQNVLEVIESKRWDLMVAFPPCDRLLGAGALHWGKWSANPFEQQKAIVFFMQLALSPIAKVAVENPVGIMSTVWREPDQKINPWQFGHPEQKKTCIWLRGLEPLKPTNDVYQQMMQLPASVRERVHYESPGIKNGLTRSQRRAIMFQGIADAMAEQWGQ
jgi:hypothetical protein